MQVFLYIILKWHKYNQDIYIRREVMYYICTFLCKIHVTPKITNGC